MLGTETDALGVHSTSAERYDLRLFMDGAGR